MDHHQLYKRMVKHQNRSVPRCYQPKPIDSIKGEIMDSIRNTFIRMAVLPAPEKTNFSTKLQNNLFGAALFTITISMVLASTAYSIVFLGIDLKSSLFAVMQVALFLPVWYSITVGFKKRQEIENLFVEFENVQGKCKINSRTL